VVPTKTVIDVAHVARLARLNLTAEETALFQEQLAHVLEYADKLREPDTSHGDNDIGAETLFDVLREDEPCPWFTADEALRNVPRQANDLFVVPKVVE
jgi:aspartyl-tRNA(Asn)/glutamyl-tRNA(Gln) amidotransferase subunit C